MHEVLIHWPSGQTTRAHQASNGFKQRTMPASKSGELTVELATDPYW